VDLQPPLRVFVSHTSEFSTFPPNGSFVDAAIEAINDCGHVPLEMRSFVAESTPTPEVCERFVRIADVYVGILGHRYGALLNNRDISYTEFEYQCAATKGIPQLMFLLAADAAVPFDSFGDQRNGVRQSQFRAMVKTGPVLEFRSPEDLKYKISRSLTEAEIRINASRNPAKPARDRLRLALEEAMPEAAWCSEYIAGLVLDERPEVPVTLNGRVVFVAIDVAYELIPGWRIRGLRDARLRIRSLVSGNAEKNDLLSCLMEHRDTFLLMADYLSAQQRTDLSIRDRIGVAAHPPRSEVATAYHRPQARALLDSLWNEEDWPELERQASRWVDSKDPMLRRRARNALLAAIEAGGQTQVARVALIAANFADAPDAECVDLLQAATYAAIAGNLDAACRYVRAARARWPDDREARRLEFHLCR
jgi:hypothetical protein